MSVWRLIAKEIAYRRWNFALAVLAVAVAVACLVGELVLLAAHESQAEGLADSQEARARGRTERLQDDYRVITKGLGYNVLVLPKEQDLAEFHLLGYATATMPETNVARLAAASVITVQHLLPTLQQKLQWPEKKTSIMLIGTRGEAPLSHRDPKKPIREAVPAGEAVVGHVLAQGMGLAPGGTLALRGRTFRVREVRPPVGNEDDVTIWINLAEAQELLGKPGRISAILALSCFCAEATPEGIRREVTRVLPDTQVLELSAQAATRRAARARAAAHSAETLADEAAGRLAARAQRAAFAAWMVPLVIVACTVWVGVLALANVRERRDEIGILRALGVGARRVFSLLVARSLLSGLGGAAAGCAAGYALGATWLWRESAGEAAALPPFDALMAAGVLILAPLVSAAAALVPAMLAAHQDPADVLREE
ncbi:MAG: FtsX-like permease family protein [Planctomycetes bacterium]|nr:FtsX-like permease family protein [Planctomycetota bacterium]